MLQFRFDLQIEDGEVNGDSNKEVSTLNNVVTLPKLFVRGWTVKNVKQQALFYVLGYGNGGTNTIGRFQKAQSSKATRTFPRQVWKKRRCYRKYSILWL